MGTPKPTVLDILGAADEFNPEKAIQKAIVDPTIAIVAVRDEAKNLAAATQAEYVADWSSEARTEKLQVIKDNPDYGDVAVREARAEIEAETKALYETALPELKSQSAAADLDLPEDMIFSGTVDELYGADTEVREKWLKDLKTARDRTDAWLQEHCYGESSEGETSAEAQAAALLAEMPDLGASDASNVMPPQYGHEKYKTPYIAQLKAYIGAHDPASLENQWDDASIANMGQWIIDVEALKPEGYKEGLTTIETPEYLCTAAEEYREALIRLSEATGPLRSRAKAREKHFMDYIAAVDAFNEFAAASPHLTAVSADLSAKRKEQLLDLSGISFAELGAEEPPPFFREQCFLLAEIPYFANYKKGMLEEMGNSKRLPYVDSSGKMDGDEWTDSSKSNACLQMDGDPFGFMNRLTQYPGYHHILSMKTPEIANLQPLIRLFKVISDSSGKESQLEIPFDSHFTKNDLQLFRNKDSRGVGVGIEDFTFSYEADNPFAVKKSIKAKLTIFANNFSELLKARYIGKEEFKYVDLALKTGVSKSFTTGANDAKRSDVVIANLDKLKFRLKAVIGWNYRDSWLLQNPKTRETIKPTAEYYKNTLSPQTKKALYNSYITINLTPTIHEFDIDDQGRVKFIINYLAYVEDFFDQPAYNIFPNSKIDDTTFAKLPVRSDRLDAEKYTETARAIRDLKVRVISSRCKEDDKALGELKEEIAGEQELYRAESFKSLMRNMIKAKKVRYINLTADDVFQFRKAGASWDPSAAIAGTNIPGSPDPTGIGFYGSLAESTTPITKEVMDQINLDTDEKSKARKLQAIAATGADTGIQTVTFFYVSDLVDVILDGLADKYGDGDTSVLTQLTNLSTKKMKSFDFRKDKASEVLQSKIRTFRTMGEQLKKLRVLLGPIELVHQSTFESTFPCLGDIPISVKYFIEWLSKKMSDRDEAFYPLPKFLNDLFNDLIRNILNDARCFRNQAKQKTRINQAAVTSYKESWPQIAEGKKIDEITADILMFRMKGGTPAGRARMNSNYYGSNKQDLQYFGLPVLNIAASRDNPIAEDGVENEVNYLIYYAGRTMPTERMTGEEVIDAENGIFHYSIGRDRGITKTISLTKTDSTGLKELRFEQDGYDGLKQLREVFDVNIKTYANVHAYPGMYIFVDPKGFSPNSKMGDEIFDLTQIGIGGYHMIVRSEHSFGPGRADSTIHAKWVASTHAVVTEDSHGNKATEYKGEPKYCFEYETKAAARANAAKSDAKKSQREMKAQMNAQGDPGWLTTAATYWMS